MPGRRSSAVVSHSVTQSALAPPLALARTQSGWYCEERGNRSETSRLSEVTWKPFLNDVHQYHPVFLAAATHGRHASLCEPRLN